MRYPILYIDNCVPEGWGEDYPVRVIESLRALREFSASYYKTKGALRYGLDLRGVSVEQMTPLLSLMELSSIELVLRVYEPVPGVILSRAAEVRKISKYEVKSILDSLIEDESILAKKIRSLGGRSSGI